MGNNNWIGFSFLRMVDCQLYPNYVGVSRSMEHNLAKNKYDAPIAQLVEQDPLKVKVAGSIPAGRTLQRNKIIV